jgi:predicted N-acyltransferase
MSGGELIAMADFSLHESIAEIGPREWDELAQGDIPASHGWLRLVEETALTPLRCRCLLAREGSTLQAAIFFWRQDRSDKQTSLDVILYGRLSRLSGLLGLTVLPAFVAGQISGWQRTILFRDDLSEDDRRGLLSRMLPLLETAASSVRHTLCFRGITPDNTEMAEEFSLRNYLCTPDLPVCYLDIEWQAFDDYLRSLRKCHPRTEKNIRHEINLFNRSGVTIDRLDDPAGVCNRLHAVVDVHYRRLNGRPFPFRPEFFVELKSRLGDKALVYTARRKDKIIGVLVMLRNDTEAFLPIIGIDTEDVRKDSIYFNLAFNRPIREAIEAGLDRIWFGRLVYSTKIRRGCRLSDVNLYLRTGSGIGGLWLRTLLAGRSWRMQTVLNSLTGQSLAQ